MANSILGQNGREGECLWSIKILFVIIKSKVTRINHQLTRALLKGLVKEKMWNFGKLRRPGRLVDFIPQAFASIKKKMILKASKHYCPNIMMQSLHS